MMATMVNVYESYGYDRPERKRRRHDKPYRRRSSSRDRTDRRRRSSPRTRYTPKSDNRSSKRRCSRDDYQKRRTHSPKEDDSEGHLIYKIGDVIGGKYEIIDNLGEGTFGKVVKCKKRGHKTPVAVKIVKGIDRYTDAAELEVKVLQKLRSHDPYDESGCIHMIDWFEHHGHICLAFQLMGLSVYDFMKQNDYKPFSVDHVRAITYQLLYATRFMHDMKLTHTDLKPENMLFKSPLFSYYDDSDTTDSIISLIDFGSATFEHEHHSSTVSTRHYRAPEVVLENGWSHSCDLWSIGCIMFELLTGVTMFQTHSNFEHLCMMQHILGPMPKSLTESCKKKKYFNQFGLVNMDWDSTEGQYVLNNCKPLRYHQKDLSVENEQVYNLMEGLLQFDPRDRLTCSQALRHPFFDEYLLKKSQKSLFS